jgi:hypothetical protein
MKWTKVKSLAGGHRIFERGGLYSFADQSGHDPDRTDDGPLYFDTARPIEVGLKRIIVPVTYEPGQQQTYVTYVALGDVAELRELAPHWDIMLGDDLLALDKKIQTLKELVNE